MGSRFSFLRDLEREATPVPWATHLVDDTTVVADDGTTIAETFPNGGLDDDVDFFSPVERHEADACFIAAMRNAMPGLIDELDRIERDLASARAENDKLRAALAQARQFVSDDLRGTLECVCRLDPDTLAPFESTIDPAEAPHVERIRNVLSEIDAALAEKEPAK